MKNINNKTLKQIYYIFSGQFLNNWNIFIWIARTEIRSQF